jgi:hypothetical protein
LSKKKILIRYENIFVDYLDSLGNLWHHGDEKEVTTRELEALRKDPDFDKFFVIENNAEQEESAIVNIDTSSQNHTYTNDSYNFDGLKEDTN